MSPVCGIFILDVFPNVAVAAGGGGNKALVGNLTLLSHTHGALSWKLSQSPQIIGIFISSIADNIADQ